MAIFEKGILGGFSGKVGTVIGGTWKGIDYMRSKANKRTFVPSQKQLEQQLKFALMMRFLQPISALLEVSFHDLAIRQTGTNAAFAYNYRVAITGTFPDYALNYEKSLEFCNKIEELKKIFDMFGIYGSMLYLAVNSTCHASLRCTLWQVFAFYDVNSICL
jgi:hypothetical protein